MASAERSEQEKKEKKKRSEKRSKKRKVGISLMHFLPANVTTN